MQRTNPASTCYKKDLDNLYLRAQCQVPHSSSPKNRPFALAATLGSAMLPDEVVSHWNAVVSRNYSSLAALVFVLADYVMTVKSEYKYIWRWNGSLWSARGLYFLTRYFTIIVQIVHYCLVRIYLNRGPVEPRHCRIWFISLACSLSVLVSAFDTVLLLRIYALYKKNIKIYMLVVPLVLQYVVASFVLRRKAFGDDSFNSHCDVRDAPFESGLLGGITIASHLPLYIATFWKRREASHTVAARVVVHEGGWSFGLLTIYIGGILSYCVVTRSGNPFAIFVWPMVVVYMAACRMIINMCELQVARLIQENGTSSDTSSIAITTYINTFFTIEEIEMEEQQKPENGQDISTNSSS